MQEYEPPTAEQLPPSLRDSRKRAASLKLLIAEEDQLARDLEQLELAFDRAGNGRAQLRKIRLIRSRVDPDSEARRRTEALLATMEEAQRLLERYESLASTCGALSVIPGSCEAKNVSGRSG